MTHGQNGDYQLLQTTFQNVNQNNFRGLGINLTNISSSITTPFTSKTLSNGNSISNSFINSHNQKDTGDKKQPIFFVQDFDVSK